MILIAIGALYWDVLISLVGLGFFMYGRKRPDVVAMITGLIIVVYPYFIDSLGWSIVIGLAIIAIFAFLKRVVRL